MQIKAAQCRFLFEISQESHMLLPRAYGEAVSHIHGMDGFGVRLPVGPQNQKESLIEILFDLRELNRSGVGRTRWSPVEEGMGKPWVSQRVRFSP